MTLSHPAWLWLLPPWIGLLLLTLRAYRRKTLVPFLLLWPRSESGHQRRHGWRPPSLVHCLILAALLLLILALSEPALSSKRPRLGRVSIILDRGVTMLASSRLHDAASRAIEAITPLLDEKSIIRLLDTQGADQVILASALREIPSRPASAQISRTLLPALLKKASDNQPHAILVISDWSISDAERRIVFCQPVGPVNNVGISRAELLQDQCVVTLHNQSRATVAALAFRAGGLTTEISANMDQSNSALARSPAAGIIEAELTQADDLPDDNFAWIIPPQIPVRLEITDDLSPEVRRFARGYTTSRPPDRFSPSILITSSQTARDRSIIVPSATNPMRFEIPRVLPNHPVLGNIIFPRDIRVAAASPDPSWKTLVTAKSQPILAVNDASHQLWIGFAPADPANLDDLTNYLMLLTNAVQYCGQDAFVISAPIPLGQAWTRVQPASPLPADQNGLRAGLYTNGNRLMAIQVPAPEITQTMEAPDLRPALNDLASQSSQSPLANWLYASALTLLLGATAILGRAGQR